MPACRREALGFARGGKIRVPHGWHDWSAVWRHRWGNRLGRRRSAAPTSNGDQDGVAAELREWGFVTALSRPGGDREEEGERR
jgi:hypothetical protein